MDSFAHELALDFPVRLENPHVINPDQVWVGVVSTGPAGKTLSSSYENRSIADYKRDLGNALVNFARVIPDGVLVFFPSYSVLSACTDFWTITEGGKPSIIDRIQKFKQTVCEPRHSAQFAATIDEFKEKLSDPSTRGAMFFAVCRGKLSEGIDFADHAGRAVIITGLPYPAFQDPKVRLKREYLDQTQSSAMRSGVRTLSGKEWYLQQASRSINQAIGRVIRHRNDYGAIILCDQRFSKENIRQTLSVWVRPSVKKFTNFGQVTGSLNNFFKLFA